MASIHKRMTKSDGPRWDVFYRNGAGRQRTKTFKRHKDARAWKVEHEKEKQDGTYRDVRPAPMEEVFDSWLEDELEVRLATGDRMKPSTANTYRSIVRAHLRPAFSEYPSDQLTPQVVATWWRGLKRKVGNGELSKKTANNVRNVLGRVLAWARAPAQRFLRHNPLEGIRPMRVDRADRRAGERDFLQPDEMAALLAACATTEETAAAHLCLFCGLRRGELLALRWGDVQADGDSGGRVHVRRAISGGEVTTPKTSGSLRSVDAPGDVLATVERHRDAVITEAEERTDSIRHQLRRASEGTDRHRALSGRLPAAERARELAASDDGWVFPSETAETPVDPDNWSKRVWVTLRDRASLRDSIGLHSLRHTFASVLIDQGENAKYVSRQLGHASTSFTLDRYGHCFEETSDRAMGRLQETIRATKRRRFQVVEGGA